MGARERRTGSPCSRQGQWSKKHDPRGLRPPTFVYSMVYSCALLRYAYHTVNYSYPRSRTCFTVALIDGLCETVHI